MEKLTSKNWVKASVNRKAKTIRFTQQYYKTMSEGMQMLTGKPHNFEILNKARVNKYLAEGFKIVEKVVKAPKVETWEPKNLQGNPEVEEAIRQYYNHKKEKRAVSFSAGVVERNAKYAPTAKQIFGATKFAPKAPIDFSKAHARYEKYAERLKKYEEGQNK